jgi:glycosyltransferase involved in cell wall biosynthesis
MKVFLFHTNSFLEKGDHPRLPFYKKVLEQAGHKAEYQFLTGQEQQGGSVQKLLQAFTFAINHLKTSSSSTVFYFYSSNALFLPLYFLAKLKRIPIVFEKTELDSIRPDRSWKDKLVKFTYWMDEQAAHWFCRKMVVISPKLHDYYQNRIASIHICPAFTDTSQAKWEPAHNLYRIGYLGSFGSKDDVKGIIEAYLQARKDIPNLTLKLIGNAPESLREQYAKDVEFTGVIAQSELFEQLYECDLLVSNRQESAYAQYGSPTKLVEYLATGIPTVATDVGSYSSSLKDGVHLRFTAPSDSSLLSGYITDRYRNQEEYNSMGLAGQIFCRKNLDYQPILKNWLAFVTEP